MRKHETVEELQRLKELLLYDERTGEFRWKDGGQVGHNSNGYHRLNVEGTPHLAHRVAYAFGYGKWPKWEIDHVNGVRDDNRLANLRDVPHEENARGYRVAYNGGLPMKGRPRVPYLRVDFKVSLPAALAAEVDLIFEDPLTRRPKYGARAKLITHLLEWWLDQQRGITKEHHIPTLEELRDAGD